MTRHIVVAGSFAALLLVVGCGSDDTPAADAAPAADAPNGADAPPAPDAVPAPAPWPGCMNCECTSTNLVPLPDLAAGGTYQGRTGGLYGAGMNAPPAAHQTAGLSLAQAIGPLSPAGAPDPAGTYVFLSIGMSNASQEFSRFVALAALDSQRHAQLVVVDGAQGGQGADAWADPANNVWTVADQRLAAAGVTGAQVAVVWVKLAHGRPMTGFPAATDALTTDLVAVARNLHARYPNLQLSYWSTRTYAGYATGVSEQNPEPYAYESGFAVQDLATRQIAGDATLTFDPAAGSVQAPWIAWGPYLWTDGTAGRAGDALVWTCTDAADDGTHPSAAGQDKVAQLLSEFVHGDATAREWYLSAP